MGAHDARGVHIGISAGPVKIFETNNKLDLFFHGVQDENRIRLAL